MKADEGTSRNKPVRKWAKILLLRIGLHEFYTLLKRRILQLRANITKRLFTTAISYKGIEFQIHIPTNPGDFQTSVSLYGCYEPLLMDKAMEVIKHGDTVFDVGCGYGYFSMFAAKLNRKPERIYGFDSEPSRAADFTRNNRQFMDGMMSVVTAFVGETSEGKCVSLDNLRKTGNLPKPAVVKIDIEGFEVNALLGMTGILTRDHPHMLIEIHPHLLQKYRSDGLEILGDLITNAHYSIELCVNHRGPHRAEVLPWTGATVEELTAFSNSLTPKAKESFAIHLIPDL